VRTSERTALWLSFFILFPLPWWERIKERGIIVYFTLPLPLPSREGNLNQEFS